jgi:uncharacterized protein (TIGR02118 family)
VSVIAIQLITPDGIISDPDGPGGTPCGGWAFRHDPETAAGDKFRLGSTLDDGVMLPVRTTWQLFSRIWPGRDDPFPARMNAVPKLVATRSLTGTPAPASSRVTDGDLAGAVSRERRDVIITGSLSIVRALMAADLTGEYRLLTFPAIPGAGERLFPAGGPPAYLECLPAGRAGRRRRPRRICQGTTMTARFLAVYQTPAGPETFDRHYREVHIPLIRHLPGLRRYTAGRDVAALRGAPCYLITELEWDTTDELRAAFASPEGRATAAGAARLQQIAPAPRMTFTADETAMRAHAPTTPRGCPSHVRSPLAGAQNFQIGVAQVDQRRRGARSNRRIRIVKR